MHGTCDPHDMLPGMEGASDNQNVPPSSSSTFIKPMDNSIHSGMNIVSKATIKEVLKTKFF